MLRQILVRLLLSSEILDFPWKIGHLWTVDVMTLFFWFSLDFAENGTSAKVMTVFFFFGLHLILQKFGRNMSFLFHCF